MGKDFKQKGNLGENLACDYLENIGFNIIERNYHYGHGEIDIVAEDGERLVFIEVKYRKSLEYGPPETAITKGKQKQIKRIAEAYLFENEIVDRPCRIDVIAILHLPGTEPALNHIKNAF